MVNSGSGEKMELKIKNLYNNKKGMIFTVLAIVILSVFLLTYTVYSIGENRKSIVKRVETMNNYVFSLEKDFPRQLYISGFRIIFIFEKKIVNTGNPISDIDSSFQELFFNGTLSGQEQELMNGVTYNGIIENLNRKAESVNLAINLTNPEISISQVDPWNILVTLKVDMTIKDYGNLAMWNKTEIIMSKIPIENFEDPMYILNTGGLVTNKINRTIFKPFTSGTNVANLTLHNQYSYYINSSDAPSFLDRLQGNFNPNPNGIESLVNLLGLSAQDIDVEDKSCVDHVYFSSNNPVSHNIQGMAAWFKLDDEHLTLYQVENITL